MKTHSTMLRGYDDNRSWDRSNERHTAPSAIRKKANRQHKSREGYFSKPSLYTLPYVPGSQKG